MDASGSFRRWLDDSGQVATAQDGDGNPAYHEGTILEYVKHQELELLDKIQAEQNRVIWRPGDGIDWDDDSAEILEKLNAKESL